MSVTSQPLRYAALALGVAGIGAYAYYRVTASPAPEPPAPVVAETQALSAPAAPLLAPATPQPAPAGPATAKGAPRAEAPAEPPTGAEAAAAGPPARAPAPEAPPENTKARDPLMILAKVLLDGRPKEAEITDFLRGQGPKFSLFDDDRDGRWDRAKIDYERDAAWDEEWVREGEVVVRKLRLSGQRLVLREEGWELFGE
jgi:hypothetical protein